ncbi:hypothetical protein RMATCC62417_14736 [Rhizopus microsporus]|nr:hypothetical protein RMATCC62417_14736 [Rhizopus microsporus]CEG80390.1 hypothetical protein RMATCC62417_14736 [Rhizopus microsporus]
MQTMHIKMYKFVCILLVYIIAAVFAQQQECQGVKIIYPKPDSNIQEQDLTYFILGNSEEKDAGYLVQVDIVQDTNKVVNTWKGHDELLRVTAIQQDLSQLSKQASPNTFWFRATIEQDGRECQIESGKFKMTS